MSDEVKPNQPEPAASNCGISPSHWQRMTDLEWTGPTMIDNFDGDAYERVMLRTRATGPKDLASEDLEGEVFKVKYWAVHVSELVDRKTGEITKNLRTVLISPEGQVAAFTSGGIAASLAMFVEGLGVGPYDPPLGVIVRAGKSSAGMRVLSLTLAPREPAKPAGGKNAK